jgi:hypothetical protein
MTGFLTLSGAPTANLHAATKKYVDDRAEYDIHSQANGTLGTSVPSLITHVVAVRAFTIQASGHQAFARVGPTGSNAIFTIKVNGVSKGTLTFTTTAGSPNVDQLQSFTLTQTSIVVGDSITVELTTADSNDDLADVAITIVGELAT